MEGKYGMYCAQELLEDVEMSPFNGYTSLFIYLTINNISWLYNNVGSNHIFYNISFYKQCKNIIFNFIITHLINED